MPNRVENFASSYELSSRQKLSFLCRIRFDNSIIDTQNITFC